MQGSQARMLNRLGRGGEQRVGRARYVEGTAGAKARRQRGTKLGNCKKISVAGAGRFI